MTRASLTAEERAEYRVKLKDFYERTLVEGQGAYFNVYQGELVPTQMGRHWLREHLAIIEGMLALGPEDDLLDVGCGEGYYTTALSRHAGKSVGLDMSRSILSVLQSLRAYDQSKLKLVEADVESLPFANASFDKALCSHVLEHVLDDAAVVSEINRVLRPGGVAVLAVPLKFTPQHRLLTRATDIARAVLKPGKRGTPMPAPGALNKALIGRQAHIRHYSADSFEKMIEEQGFKVTETTGVFFHDPRNWFVYRTQRNALAYGLLTRISKWFPQMGAAVVVRAVKPGKGIQTL